MASRSLSIQLAFANSARFAASVGWDLARSPFVGRPLELIAADAILRAPNAGRSVPALAAGEVRVRVGSPPATLSLAIIEAERSAPRGVVFVLHGIRDSKRSMHAWGARLSDAGFRSVMVDLRGHGASTGATLSYGVREADDLRQALDALSSQGLVSGPVGVAGFSYGAAVAIQWAGIDSRVAAVVAVAPFASLREVIPGYLPLPFAPSFFERVLELVGERGGFDPKAASPRDAIARSQAEILLLHGKSDPRIPASHAIRIRDARPDRTELCLIDGASHRGVVTAKKTKLVMRLPEWFGRHLPT